MNTTEQETSQLDYRFANGAVFCLHYQDGWRYQIARPTDTTENPATLCILHPMTRQQALARMEEHVRLFNDATAIPHTRERLQQLENEAAAIRKTSGISEPGDVLYQEELDPDRAILVIADGLGSAVLTVINGSYPVNCMCEHEQEYPTEQEAIKAAENWQDSDEKAAA